jgi:hypothetical protein
MKFVGTVFIDNDKIERYLSGQEVLQVGQWVQFAWLDFRSRWIGVSKAGVVHAQHSGTSEDFTRRVKNYKRLMGG